EVVPSLGRRREHARIDVVVDLEDAVVGETAQVLAVGLHRLQVDGVHRPRALGDARGGVVAVDLYDVVAVGGVTQVAAALVAYRAAARGVVEMAGERGVGPPPGLAPPPPHPPRPPPGGPEGERGQALLPAR